MLQDGFVCSLPIATGLLRHSLERESAGAVLVFEGIVRDHHGGRSVVRLDYSAYEPVVEAEWAALRRQALEEFGLAAAAGKHRLGRLEIGDCAVWIGVAASHRAQAFAACQWLIDEVKARVPIWKREHYADGTVDWRHDQVSAQAPSGI